MNPRNDRAAEALGWFSIAMGTMELAAPDALARLLGMPDRGRLIRAYGLREVANGIGLLAAENKRSWLWGRVAGDVADLATLATAAGRNGNARMAMAAVAAVTALDTVCALRADGNPEPPPAARDYSDRSGFPRPPDQMRGAARAGFA